MWHLCRPTHRQTDSGRVNRGKRECRERGNEVHIIHFPCGLRRTRRPFVTLAFVQGSKTFKTGDFVSPLAWSGRREIACVASTRFISSSLSLVLFHPPLPAFSFLPSLSEATINPLSERRSLSSSAITDSLADDGGEAARSLARPSVRPSVKCSTTTTTARRKWSLARSLAHGKREAGESDHETSKRSR